MTKEQKRKRKQALNDLLCGLLLGGLIALMLIVALCQPVNDLPVASDGSDGFHYTYVDSTETE